MGAYLVRGFAISLSLLGLTAAGLLAQTGAGGGAEAAKVKNPAPATAEAVSAGGQIFRRQCSACHGLDGTGGPPKDAGDPPASNLADAEWDFGSTDGEIFWVIRNGIEPDMIMEPWDDRLSETETWNLVHYIRSLAKR